MMRCTKAIEFDAGHRLINYVGPCARLHGHRYKVAVTLEAEQLDSQGMITDFGLLKERVGTWIKTHWDHCLLLNRRDPIVADAIRWNGEQAVYLMDGNPTAEIMAREILLRASEAFADTPGLQVSRVVVWETPDCCAEATP